MISYSEQSINTLNYNIKHKFNKINLFYRQYIKNHSGLPLSQQDLRDSFLLTPTEADFITALRCVISGLGVLGLHFRNVAFLPPKRVDSRRRIYRVDSIVHIP